MLHILVNLHETKYILPPLAPGASGTILVDFASNFIDIKFSVFHFSLITFVHKVCGLPYESNAKKKHSQIDKSQTIDSGPVFSALFLCLILLAR